MSRWHDSCRDGAAVLVAARFSLLTDLEGFLGAPGRLLPPSADAIVEWADRMAAGSGRVLAGVASTWS